MGSSKFVFDYVHLLYCKCQKKINTNKARSNVDSLDWIKKATINPINKKVNAFNIL